jgi:hypothetical protein
MTAAEASHGILATFGNFTQETKNFAKGKPIQLITGMETNQKSSWYLATLPSIA